MLGALYARRIVPFVLVAVLTLLFPALLIVAQEPTPTPATPQAAGTPLPWVTEPAATGARLVSTPIPDSSFELLFTDSFDDENYTADFWTFGTGWEQASIGGRGQVLEVSASEAPMTYLHSPLADVMAEARFLIRSGAFRLSVRESNTGNYALQVDRRGQATLYRGEMVLATNSEGHIASGQWHSLHLAVIGDTLRAWVDGNLLIETQDNNPLPEGSISFAAHDLGNDSLLVDDFSLWVPEATTPTPVPPSIPAEPQLYMVFTDEFGDAETINTFWSLDAGWTRGLSNTEWVLGSTISSAQATFANSQLDDFAVQLRFQSSGTVLVHIRQSQAGAYTAAIRSDGAVALYRDNAVVGSATITDYAPAEWHALWFSAIDSVVRIGIDFDEAIAFQDSQPLPAGEIAIESELVANEPLMVDDFELWLPVEDENSSGGLAGAGAIAVTEATDSLYWDFNGVNYAGWYSGSPNDPLSNWATTWPFYWGSGRCEHQLIWTVGVYEGLTDLGWGNKRPGCPNGYALNAVYDLGQPMLVSGVSYGVWAQFEGIGRWQEIRLIDEDFNLVLAKRYTIPSTGYGTKSHTLTTPTYVRYIQVMANHGGGADIIWDWVQLDYTAPTPTPTPTPTQLPVTATCPTTTGADATIYAGPDLGSMPVNVFLTGTGIDLMGLYINGGWYAVGRYPPEESGMAAQSMMAMSVELEGWVRAEDVVLVDEGGAPLPCLVDIPYVDENGNIIEATPTPTPSPTPNPTLPPSTIRCDAQTGTQGATLYTGAGGSNSPGVLPQNLPVGLIGRRLEQGAWWYLVHRSDDWFVNPAQGWVAENELNLANTPSLCLGDLPIISDAGDTIACTGRTMGDGPLNVRTEPNTNSSIALTLTPPPPQIVPVTGRVHPEDNPNSQGYVWYRCDFSEIQIQGWMREDILEVQCPVSWLNIEGTPNPNRSPGAVPGCLNYIQGAHGWELAANEIRRVPPDYDYHQFPPCGVTMQGPSVAAIPGMARHQLGSESEERDWFFWSTQLASLTQGEAAVRAHNLLPVPPNRSEADWIIDMDLGQGETNMSNVSCGFVASAIAARYQGHDVWPYEWMLRSVEAGISTIKGEYGYVDFAEANILPESEFFNADDSNMDTIAALLRDSRMPVVLDLVRIKRRDNGTTHAWMLQPVGAPDVTNHWVVVTGISADSEWVRLVNPFTNREEWYSTAEYGNSRVLRNERHSIVVVTRTGIDAAAVWCDNRMGADDIGPTYCN